MIRAFPFRWAIFASLIVASASAQSMHFDSGWWKSVNSYEQDGFIWGYLDSPCAPPISSPTMEVEKFLDSYLQDHSTVTIPAALQVAGHQMKPWKSAPGGEVWTDAHGFMDGGWWGDTTHGEQYEQRGYVEGYLACKHQPVNASDVHFYVAAMNKYYDSPKHEHTKISYVIEPLIAKKELH
jgi:hypothetical protein